MPPDDAAELLTMLRDTNAVVDALYRFAAGQDLKDPDLFRSAFAPNATLDFSQPAQRFGADIPVMPNRTAIEGILTTLEPLVTSHTVTNPRVQLDGDRAQLAALVEAQQRTPVVVYTNHSTCSVQFDPVGTRQFTTACDIAKSLLAGTGISYRNADSADGRTVVAVGDQRIAVADGSALAGPELKGLKDQVGKRLKSALAAEGYPATADPERMNLPVIFLWLMVFAIAATEKTA